MRTEAHDLAVVVSQQATLDSFVERVSSSDGVSLTDLEPLTTLFVRTCNSVYRIIASQNGKILVQGGRFFPDLTAGHLNGSSIGGSLLKLAWIGIGFRMEFWAGGMRIVTSPVRAIATEAAAGACH